VAILREVQDRRRPRKRRAFELDAAEQANVKRSLRVLQARLGGWEAVARKLGCTADTIQKAAGNGAGRAYRPSVGLAVRVAQLAGLPVESLITGAWFKEQACPLCGRTG
jgi:hypothetical protein